MNWNRLKTSTILVFFSSLLLVYVQMSGMEDLYVGITVDKLLNDDFTLLDRSSIQVWYWQKDLVYAMAHDDVCYLIQFRNANRASIILHANQ